jgi:hypothetical protein
MGSEVSEETIAPIFRSIVILPYVYRNDPTVCKTCYIKLHQTGSNSTVAEAHDTYCLHSFYVIPLITSLTMSCVGGGGGGGGRGLGLCCCVIFCRDISTRTAKQVVCYEKLFFDFLLGHRHLRSFHTGCGTKPSLLYNAYRRLLIPNGACNWPATSL